MNNIILRALPKSAERRSEERLKTAFFAVEKRGSDFYYRLIRNLSPSGFSFDDRFPLERVGDPVKMEFALAESAHTVSVLGRVVYVSPDRGVGVRIEGTPDPSFRTVVESHSA